MRCERHSLTVGDEFIEKRDHHFGEHRGREVRFLADSHLLHALLLCNDVVLIYLFITKIKNA